MRPSWYILPMVLALVAAGTAALAGRLKGGSLENLASTSFRWLPLLFASLLVQVGFGIWDPPWLTETAGLSITLTSMLGVAVFLARNRHHPGTLLAALGLALNVLVIGANGAMPVSADAAEVAGIDTSQLEDAGIKHERMTDATRLSFLGDVIPVPGTQIVISIGDVILAAGLARLTYRRMLTPSDEDQQPST